MRLLQLHHFSNLNIYDIARFGCGQYFAAEALPASEDFADGQGAGLWRRRFGTRGLPVAIEGSELFRIYQLAQFTRGDGVSTLVGLGVLIADLFDDDLPLPQRWALKTPFLKIFYSSDGEIFLSHSLHDIERADGDYPLSSYIAPDDPAISKEEDFLWNRPASIQNALMNSTAKWKSGINEVGDPCLWTCSGTHLIEWDGYDARVTPLGQRATALALSNGKFYFSAGSRTSIEATDGVLAFTNVDATSLQAPKTGDEKIVIVPPGTNLLKFKDKPGAVPHVLHSVQYVGGQWLVLVAREWITRSAAGETTKQEIAAFFLPSLPTEAIEIPTSGLEYLELSTSQEYFDLGRKYNPLNEPARPPDPIVARFCSGRAFIFQRKDFQDQAGVLEVADMDRETVPVLEMLCNPSLADFDITAAIPLGEGHVLGTADGYLLSARVAQNRLNALARLDDKVLKLLTHNARFYALTAGALWQSENGAQWEVLREVHEDHLWRDALITEDGRLFAVSHGADSGGGPNSRVVIYNVTGAPEFIQEDFHLGQVRDVLVEYSGLVYVFGTDEGGEYHVYDEGDSIVTDAAALEAENVTAAAVDGSALFVGTQSGKLLKLESGAWSTLATAPHPIAALQTVGNDVCLGYSDGAGVFGVWDGAEITEYSLNAPCARDARVFLPDGGDGTLPCGLIVLTDAGPVFWNCLGDEGECGDAVWFSSLWNIEAGEDWDAVLAYPLAADGSPLKARAFVGPEDAGDDLTRYQPLEPGCQVRLLHPLSKLRFAVVHDSCDLHKQYEFTAFRRTWSE
jgi:hypothetical protein